MNLDQFKLSEDERSLLIEMTDFGVPLYEVLGDVRIAYPDSSSIEQLDIAKRLVYSVVEKDLASLCKLTLENTHDTIYEVNDSTSTSTSASMSTSMSVGDIKDLMSLWEQSSDALDSSISYELAPTELGEKVLDEIFNIKHSN